jgi:ferritin
MLNNQIEKMLNDIIQIEQVSSTLYLAMSYYMANKNYTGMAP